MIPLHRSSSDICVLVSDHRYQNCVYTYRILPSEDMKLSVQVGQRSKGDEIFCLVKYYCSIFTVSPHRLRTCWEPSISQGTSGCHGSGYVSPDSPQSEWSYSKFSTVAPEAHVHHNLLNLLLFTELWFYLANTSRASRFQAGSTGAPLWMAWPHAALVETVSGSLGRTMATRGSAGGPFARPRQGPSLLFLLPGADGSRARLDFASPGCKGLSPCSSALALTQHNFPPSERCSAQKSRLKL